jgi:hypothetical protein
MATITEELIILFRALGTAAATGEIDAVTAATAKSGKAAKKADEEHTGFGKSLKSLKSAAWAAAGTVGIGGLAVGIGESIKAAENMQAVQAQLGIAIRNNVQRPAADATKQMTDFAESLSMRGGFTATDTIQNFSMLLGATKSVTESEKDMTLATEISRQRHMDLSRAVRAVALVEQGRTTGLGRMGIVLPKVTAAQDALKNSHIKATAAQMANAKALDAMASRQQAMQALTKQFGGALTAYSHTAAGSINTLKNSVEVLSVKVGTALLPMVVKLVGWLMDLVKWVQKNSTLVEVLGSVLLILVGTFKAMVIIEKVSRALQAYSAAQKAAAAATGDTEAATVGLNMAVLTSPWFWAIAAILALVAAFVILWLKCKWFRDFWIGLWKDVVKAVDAAVKWITRAWKDMAKWIGDAAQNVYRWVTGAFHDVLNWVRQNWPYLLGALTGPFSLAIAWIVKHWDTVKKLPGELLKLFKDIGGDLLNAIVWPFKTAFQWVSHHLPSFHVHHIGPIPIPLPSFPGLATGGVTPYGGAFVVGERGPELVTLPQGANVSSQDDLKQTNTLLRELIRAVQQNSNVLTVDGRVLAQAVNRQGLLQQARS